VKKLYIVLFLAFSTCVFAQFKDSGFETESPKDGIVKQEQGSLLGFLNSDDFIMRHSFSLSYSSFAGEGVSLGTYTNSMFYKLMDNLNVQLDVSVVNSPYSTLGEGFQKSINGIYVTNASLNYRPWKDVSVYLQYRNMPFGYGYYNPFYRYNSPFDLQDSFRKENIQDLH